MRVKSVTANPSQIMIEQLVGSGVKYVFNNPGSLEARFFDALHGHPEIDGIMALHEGSVAAMAGGYTQVKLDPAVMVVHLGAGLAQCLGQLYNVWCGRLPVVVITFAGDTGSYTDRRGLDLAHSFGPTSISSPFSKATWTVLEPEGLPQAIDRALRVAKTPPVGPVHLAVYDRVLGSQEFTANVVEGGVPALRAGGPADSDLEELAQALRDAKCPLLYIGDGVWKSGAEAQVVALAEHFGIPVSADWGLRGLSITHELHCGLFERAAAALSPDTILCIGARPFGFGPAQDSRRFSSARRIIAVGSGVENFQNIPGLDLAIVADERRTLEALEKSQFKHADRKHFDVRRAWAVEQAGTLRAGRMKAAQSVGPEESRVRPWVLAKEIHRQLERMDGGFVVIEQFAVPMDSVDQSGTGSCVVYIQAAGGSEGYGIGAAIGVKLAAPDRPVIGLVGDGSLFYADSALWTAVHHGVPVLYVIPNNHSYGIVASAFERADGLMKQSGEYAGVVLGGINPVKIAEGFGLEGMHVQDESCLSDAIAHGLRVVEEEKRPFLLNVDLPLGLPKGGRAAAPFRFA